MNRSDYQQLVFAALGGHGCRGSTLLLPPAIWKPIPLWSGKQVLSTVVINLTPKGKARINMESTAKISIKDWQNSKQHPWKAGGSPFPSAITMTETEVIFRKGELLCGVLDKMHYGSTSYSLVHSFCELYGGQYSCRLLSCFSKLFTAYLQLRGFTLGVEDILVTTKADHRRKKIIEKLAAVKQLFQGLRSEQVKKWNFIDVFRLARKQPLGQSVWNLAIYPLTIENSFSERNSNNHILAARC